MRRAIDEPVVPTYRDYAKEQPVSDEVFKIYQSLFDYDKTSLDARTESADDSSALWRKEKVTFNAAYGNERVIAYVYLPKKNSPPYQVVIFCPGAGAPFSQRSSEKLGGEDRFEFVVEGGRAMVFPIYKGIFERGDGTRTAQSYSASKNDWRDLVVHWSKDLGRTLDYLETRKDIRSDKVGYFGFSLGAVMGSTLTAVEDRIKTNIFVAGGMSLYDVLPQVAQINFAPKIKIPTLMINGRYDFTFIEPSQRRLFDLLGSPPENKRYILLEKGHVLRGAEVAKDATEWLDRFLGPVK